MTGDAGTDQDGLERAWQLAELIAAEAVRDSPDWRKIAAWAKELATSACKLAAPGRQN